MSLSISLNVSKKLFFSSCLLVFISVNLWLYFIDSKITENFSTITNKIQFTLQFKTASEKSDYEIQRTAVDIGLIFTNAQNNSVLENHLKTAVISLLKNAGKSYVRLHLIVDETSSEIGSKIIKIVVNEHGWDYKNIKLIMISTKGLAEEVESKVKLLQSYFTSINSSRYRDLLFFFSLFLHLLLPGLEKIILMDIDIKVNGDVSDLYSHFSNFTDDQVVGLSPELSPVYRHVLSVYRKQNPDTNFGSPVKLGGFPGYNSGVMLINIPKLKNSKIINSFLTKKKLDEKTKKYSFRGHLGDQDLYTLIALDHPEIFYTLPCEWNRQLCEWWNIKLYEDVFDDYFRCDRRPKILHGNCKSKIP